MSITIEGSVASGFEPVCEAFARAFEGRPRMGASLAVRVGGKQVVSLWAGTADFRTGRPWERETPSVIFSCTKGLTSLMLARLVDEGRLSYSDVVAAHWPEFASAGKDGVTVAQLAAHRAGLSAPRKDLTLEDLLDWETMAGVLAEQAPLWAPGTGYAYHALTHGWLMGEMIRRITGEGVGAHFRRTITGPLRAAVWIGAPEAALRHVAHLHLEPAPSPDSAPIAADDWAQRAVTLCGALPISLVTETGGFNDKRLLAAEIPGAGGIATAEGLAAIWSAAVTETEGQRFLSDAGIARALVPLSEGAPVFAPTPPFPRWSAGFMLDSAHRRLLGPRSFGHDGAGGQIAFADPDHAVGFAFITNQMEGRDDARGNDVVTALRSVLG